MKKIILDTDMLTDCDDAAAIALLLNLEALGACEVLGMAVSSRYPMSAAVVSAINTYYGRAEIPVGAPMDGHGAYRPDSCFLDVVASEYPHPVSDNAHAENAVRLYRRLLAAEDARSVTMVTIGYMTNLKDLLHSDADECSPLDGVALVREKVDKWVCMGGNFPVDAGKDNVNFTRDMPSAYDAITRWPTDIHFVGREIGHNIFAGEGLRNTPADNPVRRAYQLHRNRYTPDNWNHHTADPTTVLYAVCGEEDNFRLSARGDLRLKPTGEFSFTEQADGRHLHVLQKGSRDALARMLNEWMARTPADRIGQ